MYPVGTRRKRERRQIGYSVVGDDKHLLFSSSREPNRADDKGRVLLEAGEVRTKSSA